MAKRRIKHARVWGVCVCVAFAAVVVGQSSTSSEAASSSTVIAALVPSATSLSAAACASSTPATNFGVVLPGTTARTTADCTVSFGSSNDTSRLRMYQTDQGGVAMWRTPMGPVDASVGGGTGLLGQVISSDTAFESVTYDPSTNRYYATGHFDGGAGLARLMPDGSLDTTWGGGDGWIRPVMGGGSTDYGFDLAVQTDGKIVVSGRMFDGWGESDRIGVYRVTSAGAMDPTFGGGDGWVSYDYGDPWGMDVAVAPDGDILLCGYGASKGGDDGAYVMRLNPDGTPDTSYGYGDATPGDGISFLVDSSSSFAQALEIDPVTGKVLVVGRHLSGSWLFSAWRLDATGAPDTSYNGDGLAEYLVGGNRGWP